MFTILVAGKNDINRSVSYAQRFSCEKCGCIFKTDMFITRENPAANKYYDITICPWCGNEIEEVNR